MAGRYCLFGKSEKWLSGIAFFVEKIKNGWRVVHFFENKWLVGCAFLEKVKNDWWVVPFFWKQSKMAGVQCIIGKKELR